MAADCNQLVIGRAVDHRHFKGFLGFLAAFGDDVPLRVIVLRSDVPICVGVRNRSLNDLLGAIGSGNGAPAWMCHEGGCECQKSPKHTYLWASCSPRRLIRTSIRAMH